MLADSARSGFASIPWMYLASTSTTRFLILMRYAFREHKAQNKPYSLSFGCTKWDSWSLRVIELNHTVANAWIFSNTLVICEVSTTRITGVSDV